MTNNRLTKCEATQMPAGEPRGHIVVLMGGLSSERDVSLMSAKGIIASLVRSGYQVTPIDMGRDVSEHLLALKPDLVFNALHGTYGEDGCVPGMLEILGIPFTHSGVLASAIGMDKVRAKALFQSNGIRCPGGFVLKRSQVGADDPLPRPYVLKPISEGSSVGVHLVFPGDNFDIRDYEWTYGDEVMIEPYIAGREIQVAVLGDEAIGAIEIRPKGRFYTYESKYTDGQAEHIMPAPIPADAYQMALDIALKAHRVLGCKSVSRSDMRYNDAEGGDGNLYLLEVNTHPGMTPYSLVPEIAAHAGISFDALLERIIADVKQFPARVTAVAAVVK